MRKHFILLLTILLAFAACKSKHSAQVSDGYFELAASIESLQELSTVVQQRSIDSQEFLVYIYNKNGNVIAGYPKVFGEMATRVTLTPGEYQVKVFSEAPEDFPYPTTDEFWVYNGESSFIIEADEVTSVKITANLLTSKVQLLPSDEFCLAYPDYEFNLSGITLDASSNKAIYVEGGKKLKITLSYTENDEKIYKTYTTTDVIPRGVEVTINFNYKGASMVTGDAGFEIIVDSSLGSYNIDWDIDDGEITDGNSTDEKGGELNPYTVEEAKLIQDSSEAWVEGFIVGFVKGSSTVTANYLEAEDSNVAIASKAGETDITKMLFVELQASSANVRSILGISSTSGESLGYFVKFKGNLEKYFSRDGLKGISTDDEYEIISR